MARATRNWRVLYHLRKKDPIAAARDVAKQDRLLAICERLSGIALPE